SAPARAAAPADDVAPIGFNADFSVVALSGFSYFAPARIEGTAVPPSQPAAMATDYAMPWQISVTAPPKPGASIRFGVPTGARIGNIDTALAPICKPQSGSSVTKQVSTDIQWPAGTVGPTTAWPVVAPPSPMGFTLESGKTVDTYSVTWLHCDLVDPANWPVTDSQNPFTALLSYHVNPGTSSLTNFVRAATGTRGNDLPTQTTNAGMPIIYNDGTNVSGASLVWTQLGSLAKPLAPTPVLRVQNSLPGHLIPGTVAQGSINVYNISPVPLSTVTNSNPQWCTTPGSGVTCPSAPVLKNFLPDHVGVTIGAPSAAAATQGGTIGGKIVRGVKAALANLKAPSVKKLANGWLQASSSQYTCNVAPPDISSQTTCTLTATPPAVDTYNLPSPLVAGGTGTAQAAISLPISLDVPKEFMTQAFPGENPACLDSGDGPYKMPPADAPQPVSSPDCPSGRYDVYKVTPQMALQVPYVACQQDTISQTFGSAGSNKLYGSEYQFNCSGKDASLVDSAGVPVPPTGNPIAAGVHVKFGAPKPMDRILTLDNTTQPGLAKTYYVCSACAPDVGVEVLAEEGVDPKTNIPFSDQQVGPGAGFSLDVNLLNRSSCTTDAPPAAQDVSDSDPVNAPCDPTQANIVSTSKPLTLQVGLPDGFTFAQASAKPNAQNQHGPPLTCTSAPTVGPAVPGVTKSVLTATCTTADNGASLNPGDAWEYKLDFTTANPSPGPVDLHFALSSPEESPALAAGNVQDYQMMVLDKGHPAPEVIVYDASGKIVQDQSNPMAVSVGTSPVSKTAATTTFSVGVANRGEPSMTAGSSLTLTTELLPGMTFSSVRDITVPATSPVATSGWVCAQSADKAPYKGYTNTPDQGWAQAVVDQQQAYSVSCTTKLGAAGLPMDAMVPSAELTVLQSDWVDPSVDSAGQSQPIMIVDVSSDEKDVDLFKIAHEQVDVELMDITPAAFQIDLVNQTPFVSDDNSDSSGRRGTLQLNAINTGLGPTHMGQPMQLGVAVPDGMKLIDIKPVDPNSGWTCAATGEQPKLTATAASNLSTDGDLPPVCTFAGVVPTMAQAPATVASVQSGKVSKKAAAVAAALTTNPAAAPGATAPAVGDTPPPSVPDCAKNPMPYCLPAVIITAEMDPASTLAGKFGTRQIDDPKNPGTQITVPTQTLKDPLQVELGFSNGPARKVSNPSNSSIQVQVGLPLAPLVNSQGADATSSMANASQVTHLDMSKPRDPSLFDQYGNNQIAPTITLDASGTTGGFAGKDVSYQWTQLCLDSAHLEDVCGGVVDKPVSWQSSPASNPGNPAALAAAAKAAAAAPGGRKRGQVVSAKPVSKSAVLANSPAAVGSPATTGQR
ncbi:MAG: hypothetical protein WCP28_19670, partial [Actinomycetes bacterium]